MNRFIKTSIIAAMGIAACGVSALQASAAEEGTHYAVCVGVSEYDTTYIPQKNWLAGCAKDAANISAMIVERGEWEEVNVNVLTNSFATKAAIREAITNLAAVAKSGDTFLFTHSSHGYSWTVNGEYTVNTGLCTYDKDYEDWELAEDLAQFASGVKVVMMVDACHSGGLFKQAGSRKSSILRASAPLREKTSTTSTGFCLAANASAAIDAIRATERRRRSATGDKITSEEIGWLVAAEYDQYSYDDVYGQGGEFTLAVLDGWVQGFCDDSGYGDGDGYADFYELWNYAKDFAIGYPEDSIEDATDAQCFNEDVLRSVCAGWVGKHQLTDDAVPYIRDIDDIYVAVGKTVSVAVEAFAPATAPVTNLWISSGDESATLEDGVFSFTLATFGNYQFTIKAANTNGSETVSFSVFAKLGVPWAENITSNSFTACWKPVTDATNYYLWVGNSNYRKLSGKSQYTGDVTRYEVNNLVPGNLYRFKLMAYSGSEQSDWSGLGFVEMPMPGAPKWTSFAVPSAQVGRPYVLDFSRFITGWPDPSIELVENGTTAEIDGARFKWTPDSLGSFDFAVVASNEFGVATNSFVVSVGEFAFKKFALCVGINEYIDISGLYGCVNDAKYMRANLVGRGEWEEADIMLLADAQATKGAIRSAITNIAAQAVSGDTFIYQHSSHGNWREKSSKDVYLCVYDENYDDDDTAYNDYELAADLMQFPAGVKMAVVVDACHSGGLFKSREADVAATKPFDLAGRVSTLMAADRKRRRDLGESVDGNISPEEIGWVTAAEYNETSLDGGFYHTDEWMTNQEYGDKYYDYDTGEYYYPDSYKSGGAFLAASTWGWWKGTADTDKTVGNSDGYCNVYEFWKSAYDFCQTCGEFWGNAHYNYNPQCTNIDVLISINLGWSGAPTNLVDVTEGTSSEEIAVLLSGSADDTLARHIANVETYADFKTWAANVCGADGETPAGISTVIASPHSWAAFALDSPVLIDEITSDDIEISSFTQSSDGVFSLEVGLADVEVGDGAKLERMVELFGLEGAFSLDGDDAGFYSDCVTLKVDECAKTANGKVKLVAEPAAESDSFFIRVNID